MKTATKQNITERIGSVKALLLPVPVAQYKWLEKRRETTGIPITVLIREAIRRNIVDVTRQESTQGEPDAVFIGWQEQVGKAPVALFNILPGRPRANSTVCEGTLLELGLKVPDTLPISEKE